MSSQTVGLFEAKTHLSELVAQAEQGMEIVITRHNKPVAKIVPVREVSAFDVERRQRAIESLQRLGAQMRERHGAVTTEEIVSWIREGRDDRTDRVLQPLPGDTRVRSGTTKPRKR